MRVDHRGLHVTVAQKLLNGSNVGLSFQQVGGKAMAKGMATGGFTDSSSSDCRAKGSPHFLADRFSGTNALTGETTLILMNWLDSMLVDPAVCVIGSA